MKTLSPTEERVVALVADGLLNKEIAHRIGCTEATVKSHVSAAIKKRGLSNRVRLAVWWTKQTWRPEASCDLRQPFAEVGAEPPLVDGFPGMTSLSYLAAIGLLAAAIAAALAGHRASRCDYGLVEHDWPGGAVTCVVERGRDDE